jgi:sulfatase modifying factor 1
VRPPTSTILSRGSALAAVAMASAATLVACGQLLGVTDWVDVGTTAADASPTDANGGTDGGDGGGGDAALLDGTPAVDAGPCRAPVEGGADGVLVHDFCIDSTETTVRLYEVFLNDPNVDPGQGQPPECGWNTTYVPLYPAYAGDPLALSKPETAVDWCDALAFCTYWGKHLCGNTTDGGAVNPGGPLAESEWYEACSNGTGEPYPYGQDYDASLCRTALPFDAGAGVVPTPTCVGGVPDLFDMSGNLQEWENSCTPSDAGDAAADSCVLRGGAWFFPSDSVTCDLRTGGAVNPRNGNDTSANGIRCCWELH